MNATHLRTRTGDAASDPDAANGPDAANAPFDHSTGRDCREHAPVVDCDE